MKLYLQNAFQYLIFWKEFLWIKITFGNCVLALWIHKGYFVVKKLAFPFIVYVLFLYKLLNIVDHQSIGGCWSIYSFSWEVWTTTILVSWIPSMQVDRWYIDRQTHRVIDSQYTASLWRFEQPPYWSLWYHLCRLIDDI